MKSAPNYWDFVALGFIFTIIILFAWGGMQMASPYHLGQQLPISLDPPALPKYALFTVLRMFAGLFFSLLFTFTIATWAAKSPYANASLFLP